MSNFGRIIIFRRVCLVVLFLCSSSIGFAAPKTLQIQMDWVYYRSARRLVLPPAQSHRLRCGLSGNQKSDGQRGSRQSAVSYFAEIKKRPGGVLLSREAALRVPSALVGLTAGFGMESRCDPTGVATKPHLLDFGFRIGDFGFKIRNPKSEIQNPI